MLHIKQNEPRAPCDRLSLSGGGGRGAARPTAMVAQLCPSSCLILCTSTILELLPPQHLVDADMECPSSCVHACVEASRVHERSGGSFGQSLKDNFEMISIIASVILALLGHWINRQREMESERRRLRLERLDAQLRDYFGPIAANLLSSKLAFNTLMRTWSRHTHASPGETPAAKYFRVLRRAEKLEHASGEIEVEWVRDSWISFHTQIVGPIHKQTMHILQSKSHLYDGSYSTQMLQFIAHQIEYDLLMLRWAQGEYNMLINTVEFPQGFEATVAKEMARLREEQQDLIVGRDRDHEKDSAWQKASAAISKATAGSVDAERRASINAKHNIELVSAGDGQPLQERSKVSRLSSQLRASAHANPMLKDVAKGILGHTDALKHLHNRESSPSAALKSSVSEALEGLDLGESAFGEDVNGSPEAPKNGITRLFPAGSGESE